MQGAEVERDRIARLHLPLPDVHPLGLRVRHRHVIGDFRFAAGRIDYSLAWLLLTFLGLFGIHRFYLGKWPTGLLYLLTAGLFGLGYLYDYWTLNGQIDEINRRPA